jgi:hypothetical protein
VTRRKHSGSKEKREPNAPRYAMRPQTRFPVSTSTSSRKPWQVRSSASCRKDVGEAQKLKDTSEWRKGG